MELPIYIDGCRAGTLRMEKLGCHTLLRGEMTDPGRLVRLCLYGEREVYLGVPQPEKGRLVFCRKLTPREMSRFPQKPEYAAEHRIPNTPLPPPEEPETKRHVLWQGGRPYFF